MSENIVVTQEGSGYPKINKFEIEFINPYTYHFNIDGEFRASVVKMNTRDHNMWGTSVKGTHHSSKWVMRVTLDNPENNESNSKEHTFDDLDYAIKFFLATPDRKYHRITNNNPTYPV